jgi:GNAT superfamily N-acetyltransferase
MKTAGALYRRSVAAADQRSAGLLPGVATALSFSAADVLGKIVFNDGMDVPSFVTALRGQTRPITMTKKKVAGTSGERYLPRRFRHASGLIDRAPTQTEPMVCWSIIATIRYCRSEHQPMDLRIVPVSDQPELAPIVAEWLLGAFGHPGSPTFDGMIARIMAPRVGPEETFVLFEGEIPVATASLARHDLNSRPDLTPWLAGVFVEPAFRQRGYATALVRHVEARAMAASVPTLWLNTWTAESLYARLGWQRVGLEKGNSQEVVLMRRSLSSQAS